MKTSAALRSRLFFLVIPFLFTGCYTQFQTYDQFPVENDRYSSYYSWDGFEKGKASQNQQPQSESSKQNNYEERESDEVFADEELQLEMNDIYYRDFETKRWYEENYADRVFWNGYREGYTDGFNDGWNGYYPHNAYYQYNRHRYLFGYYHAPYYGSWFGLQFMLNNGFYVGYNYYGYHPYYYDYYWGHPYYSFYNYGYAYNSYYRPNRYSRNTDLYRKGPRSSGLNNYSDSRIRSGGSSITRTANSSVRSRSSSDLTRSRSNTAGTGSTSTYTTGTNSRTLSSSGNSSTRSRGVTTTNDGANRAGSSTTRSRGTDSYVGKSSDIGNSSVGSRDRTYSIPTSRVSTTTRNSVNSSNDNGYFSVRDFFRAVQGSPSDRTSRSSVSGTSSTWNTRSTTTGSQRSSYSRSSNNSSSSVSRSSSSNSRSRSSSVSRSSSSSTSKSTSRSSGSSSSSKRSRGN